MRNAYKRIIFSRMIKNSTKFGGTDIVVSVATAEKKINKAIAEEFSTALEEFEKTYAHRI